MKKKILAKLKPRAKSLGFDTKELEGIAEHMAGNLSLNDEATDEEVDAAIDAQINATLPFLKLSQAMANRVIEKAKKKQDEPEEEVEDVVTPPSPAPNKGTKGSDADDTPAWAKGLFSAVEKLTTEMVGLKSERTAQGRKARLNEALNGAGAYGSRIMKNFERMSFGGDEEFEDFLSEVKEDLKAYNKERTEAGLKSLTSVPGVTPPSPKKEVQPLTEDEVKALARL